MISLSIFSFGNEDEEPAKPHSKQMEIAFNFPKTYEGIVENKFINQPITPSIPIPALPAVASNWFNGIIGTPFTGENTSKFTFIIQVFQGGIINPPKQVSIVILIGAQNLLLNIRFWTKISKININLTYVFLYLVQL